MFPPTPARSRTEAGAGTAADRARDGVGAGDPRMAGKLEVKEIRAYRLYLGTVGRGW
jgi:hypothetical protein